ncbi:MAG: hypothetical protein GY765_02310 [bacterium]|nr:hypothetical protein [bacterium]
MIHIKREIPGDEWKKWKDTAAEETEALLEDVKAGKKPALKERIWQALKPFLQGFQKKCAYCEVDGRAGSHYHVEHYRPKKKVTTGKGKATVRIVDSAGNEKDHPGYYWLAYRSSNLLLACEKCNAGFGKMTDFPITGTRARTPDDSLDDENPLLINPYQEYPEDHIAFGKKGIIVGKTEKGRATIAICDLEREELQNARQGEWEKVKMGLLIKIANGGDDKVVPDEMQFSAYLREELKRYPQELAGEIEKRI